MNEVVAKPFSCENCAHHVKEFRRGHFKEDPSLGKESDFCNAVEITLEDRQKFHVCGGKTRTVQCPACSYDPYKP